MYSSWKKHRICLPNRIKYESKKERKTLSSPIAKEFKLYDLFWIFVELVARTLKKSFQNVFGGDENLPLCLHTASGCLASNSWGGEETIQIHKIRKRIAFILNKQRFNDFIILSVGSVQLLVFCWYFCYCCFFFSFFASFVSFLFYSILLYLDLLHEW